MPIYEYECGRCRLRFELKRPFGQNGSMPCPRCQGDTRRLFSPVPIIFKGSGFYVTDSRKNHDHPLDGDNAERLEPDRKTECN